MLLLVCKWRALSQVRCCCSLDVVTERCLERRNADSVPWMTPGQHPSHQPPLYSTQALLLVSFNNLNLNNSPTIAWSEYIYLLMAAIFMYCDYPLVLKSCWLLVSGCDVGRPLHPVCDIWVYTCIPPPCQACPHPHNQPLHTPSHLVPRPPSALPFKLICL